MRKLLTFPEFENDEKNTLARTIIYTSAGLILFSLIYIATVPFYAPALIGRSVRMAGFVIPVSGLIIIFVKRKPYSSDHYYTDINNGTSPDRFLAANGIYIYNLRTGQERGAAMAAAGLQVATTPCDAGTPFSNLLHVGTATSRA